MVFTLATKVARANTWVRPYAEDIAINAINQFF